MEKFNFKIGDLELRSCNKQLISSLNQETAEIVKWMKKDNVGEYCYTVAYWIESNEGFDLKFVGNRPFKLNYERFMHLADIGQKMLDKIYEM